MRNPSKITSMKITPARSIMPIKFKLNHEPFHKLYRLKTNKVKTKHKYIHTKPNSKLLNYTCPLQKHTHDKYKKQK